MPLKQTYKFQAFDMYLRTKVWKFGSVTDSDFPRSASAQPILCTFLLRLKRHKHDAFPV